MNRRNQPESIMYTIIIIAFLAWLFVTLSNPAPAFSADRPPAPRPTAALEITTVETIYEGTMRVTFSDGAMLMVHLARLTSPSPQAGPATRGAQRCERYTGCVTRFTDHRGIAFYGK